MKIQDLMFIGIGGKVVALYRDSGQQAWLTKLGGDFVNVAVHGDNLYAATGGEIFCLDPLTGSQLWHNPLKGCGIGLATFAFSGNSLNSVAVAAAERTRRYQAAAAAGAATAS